MSASFVFAGPPVYSPAQIAYALLIATGPPAALRAVLTGAARQARRRRDTVTRAHFAAGPPDGDGHMRQRPRTTASDTTEWGHS